MAISINSIYRRIAAVVIAVLVATLAPIRVAVADCDCGCEPAWDDEERAEGEYVLSSETMTPNPTTNSVNSNDDGPAGWTWSRRDVCTAAASGDSCSREVTLHIGFWGAMTNSAPVAPCTATVSNHHARVYTWNGAPGIQPGGTYTVHYQGNGSFNVTGSVTGNTGSASGAASVQFSGSAGGTLCGTGPKDIGDSGGVDGSCNYNVTGSVSISPNPATTMFTIQQGQTGTGSFSRNGGYTVDAQVALCIDPWVNSITLSSTIQATATGTTTADGTLLFHTYSDLTANAFASLTATTTGITRCD